jgi:nucleotide-binding universal stress UspA family protein
MKPTKSIKVLIALDYDPTAQKVANAGFSMAKAMNAEVTLLHVIADPVYYSSTAYSPIMGLVGDMETFKLQLENMEGVKTVTQHFLDKFKHHLGDETIQTVIKEGDFADTILKTAKNVKADVIVMGSHSRKWLDNILMGSVTQDVLKLTTVPLFIIPTKKQG